MFSHSFESENKAGIKTIKDREKSEGRPESKQSKDRTATAESEIGARKETKKDNTVNDKGEDEEISRNRRFSEYLHFSTSTLVGKCRKSTTFLL